MHHVFNNIKHKIINVSTYILATNHIGLLKQSLKSFQTIEEILGKKRLQRIWRKIKIDWKFW